MTRPLTQAVLTYRSNPYIHSRTALVVTLYLSDSLNERLRPKLLKELRPGSNIISHDFRMGDWQPEQTVRVPWGNLYRTVYVWTVPQKTGAKKNGK